MSGGSTPAGEPSSGPPAGRISAPDRNRRRGRRDGGGRRNARGNAARGPVNGLQSLARGIGQLLITAGVIVLLFVVYEVYITDIFGHEKQQKATSVLDSRWNDTPIPTTASVAVPSRSPVGSAGGASAARGSAGPGSPGSGSAASSTGTPGSSTKVVTVTDPNKLVTDPGTRKRNYQTIDGQGFAKIFVPAFGADYAFTIIEGTSTEDLYSGPGHYADTQYPGELGNFAVAGHRVSKGSPFNQLGLLASCDAVVVETKSAWFVYRVLPMADEVAGWFTTGHAHCAGVAPPVGPYAKTYGREITQPSDYAQVLPVPSVRSSKIPADAARLITLTTCHPQFSDAERMILHGLLVKTYRKATGFLPPELNES